MATFYRIKFYSSTQSNELNIAPGFSEKIVNGLQDNSVAPTLGDISFVKKIFSPCQINASVKFTTAVTYNDVIGLFKGYDKVKLEFTSDGTNFIKIADNYIIRGIKPVFTKNGAQTGVTVKIKICSPDILLTDRKYCRTYVKDKLGSILDDAAGKFEKGKLDVDHSKMLYLNYTASNNAVGTGEFRHPYLVQYNESVYDLIARTANRCGEFLYFENGKLNLGLPSDSGNATNITNYDSLTVNEDEMETVADTSQSYTYNNPFVHSKSPDNSTPGPTQEQDTTDAKENNSRAASNVTPKDFPINNEVAYDEYLGVIQKDGYDSPKGEDDVNCNIFADIFSTLLQCTVWYDTIIDIGLMIGKRKAVNSKLSTSNNKAFNDKFFPDNDVKGEDDYKKKSVSDKYDVDQYNYDYLTQFKTCASEVKTPNDMVSGKQIDGYFYEFVFSTEAKVAENNIELSLEATNIQDIKLGDKISVSGVVSDSTYVVTEISGSEKSAGDSTWSEKMSVKAVKIINGHPVPPPCVSDFIRRGGAQTAVVKDLTDPDRAGRVRLQFPWDSASNWSPWARVAMSSANSEGGGEAYFKPSKGDEVLVEYIGGNMERPYVTGFLHSSKGLENGGRTFNTVISTPGGQIIRQKDTNDKGAFWGSIFPLFGMLRTMIPGIKFETDNEIYKGLMGYTEITDTFGMYDIMLSSDKRAVTISSPFGKVGINAYTGISIEAPNGDIKISGKNVTIEAGNNIQITSGKNLKDNSLMNWSNWTMADVMADVSKRLLVDEILAKLIDLKLIRCIIETIVKPVEGTLEIKSNRFLLIEAGGGESQIPKSAFNATKYEKKYFTDYQMLALVKVVDQINTWTTNLMTNFQQKYAELSNARQSYIDLVGDNAANLVGNFKADKLIENKDNVIQENDILAVFSSDEVRGIDENTVKRAIVQISSLVSEIHNKRFYPDIDEIGDLPKKNRENAKKAFEDARDAVVPTILEIDKYKFDNSDNIPDQDTLKKKIYRTLVAHVIKDMAESCKLKLPADFNADGDWTDEQWKKLYDKESGISIKKATAKTKITDKIVSGATGLVKNTFKRFYDIGVWDENGAKGDILLSNSESATAQFSNNGSFTMNPNIGYKGEDSDNANETDETSANSLKGRLNVLKNKLKVNSAINERIVANVQELPIQNVNNENPNPLIEEENHENIVDGLMNQNNLVDGEVNKEDEKDNKNDENKKDDSKKIEEEDLFSFVGRKKGK